MHETSTTTTMNPHTTAGRPARRWRAAGALAVAALALVACSKTADKGATEKQLQGAGFTKDESKCITDEVWDKIPSKERDRLTEKNAELTDEQKQVLGHAVVGCAKENIVTQLKAQLTDTGGMTSEVADCIVGKLSDDDLAAVFSQQTPDSLTQAATTCAPSS